MVKKEPEPGGPTMLVRKGRYLGQYSRNWQSAPFGEAFISRPGQTHEVRESFKYLWEDKQYAALWEWEGEPEMVPAINEGQVPPPK